jgi:hypothetical protein
LFLEQYKLAAGNRLAFVQGKLDQAVPQEDYVALQTEMESLREDHLVTLRREVEARAAALKALDRARELRSIRLVLAHQQEDLEKARNMTLNLEAELIHQKEVTGKALAAVQSSAEVSKIITELAKYRGEASRLEVELLGSNRRAELATENMNEVTREVEQLSARVKEMELREEQYVARESEARKALVTYKLQYEGGLTRDEKDGMKLKCEKLEQSIQEAQREITRLKELADIAANQARALTQYKSVREEENKELRDYCTRLESRTEDEILIGRLQRQLMSTKTSYKSFVRKYQQARENVRDREIALRMAETRLADQEKQYHEHSTARRKEMIALKQALRNVREVIIEAIPVTSSVPKFNGNNNSNLTESAQDLATLKIAAMSKALIINKGSKLVTSAIGSRVAEISDKVNCLEELAENAVTQAAQKEEECRRLMSNVEELQAEKTILQQRLSDLDIIINGSVAKQQTVATRLISLSEDVRTNKLSNLKQRRQIQIMREETKHLRALIAKMEADMIELEKSKVNSEASEYFAANIANGKSGKSVLDALGEDPTEHELQKSISKLSIQTDHLHPEADDEEENRDPQLVHQLRQAVHASSKEIGDLNLRASTLSGRIQELELFAQEKESQLGYYEKVLSEHGLGGVVLRQQQQSKSGDRGKASGMTMLDQEKLQEAANATIGSMRALLEEKNRLIEKYRDKIDQLMNTDQRKSRAERHAEDILERIAADEQRSRGSSKTVEIVAMGDFGGVSAEAHKRLSAQLEQADSIIADKDRTLMQLEQNLSMQTNQRERAELRCGEALKEMDAMKADLITLAQQLQESEARCTHLSKTTTNSVKLMAPENTGKLRELERIVKGKEEKIKGYREIIVRLKEEFIKSEQDKAATEMKNRNKHDGHASITPEELRDLKGKVSEMYEGLRQAKEDLDKARRGREKISHERNVALEDVKKLEEALQKADSQVIHGQQMVNRLKKDLEECRRKEVRLKERLKELMDSASARDGLPKGGKELVGKAKDRIEQLERDIDLLKAQNAALRRADKVDSMISGELRGERAGKEAAATAVERSLSPSSRGQMLGGTGGIDDARAQLHAKWESEKKLQKR